MCLFVFLLLGWWDDILFVYYILLHYNVFISSLRAGEGQRIISLAFSHVFISICAASIISAFSKSDIFVMIIFIVFSFSQGMTIYWLALLWQNLLRKDILSVQHKRESWYCWYLYPYNIVLKILKLGKLWTKRYKIQ